MKRTSRRARVFAGELHAPYEMLAVGLKAMNRFRVTVAGLMGLVFASACGFAVLRCASPFWFHVSAGITLFVFLTAIVGAIKGRYRTACLGFAIFGWGSATVAFAFAMFEAVSNQPATVRAMPTQTIPYTPLTDLLDTLYPMLHYGPPAAFINGVRVQAIRAGVVYASFQWIGHTLACLLFGCIGAIVAIISDARRGVFDRDGERREEPRESRE